MSVSELKMRTMCFPRLLSVAEGLKDRIVRLEEQQKQQA
jgi:hypothetical protein